MTERETTFERHLTVDELAEQWNVSRKFVSQLVVHEPGVIIFWRQRPGRRVYRTIRIPESVATRIHRRMTSAG
jgi:hypothetical protein